MFMSICEGGYVYRIYVCDSAHGARTVCMSYGVRCMQYGHGALPTYCEGVQHYVHISHLAWYITIYNGNAENAHAP